MNNKIDGGAAFPQSGCAQYAQWAPEGGMTLRDYFAAHADISGDLEGDGCIEHRLALSLMNGEIPPSWDNDYLEARVWWASAESRLRYMKADAMLEARNK